MSQATEVLRDKMEAYFGDRVGDEGPTAWLKSQGYQLTLAWGWLAPEGQTPTEKDLECVVFLMEEWDFGGLEGPAR